MAEEKKKESKNVFQTLLGWARDLHEWVADTFADPEIREQIILDLGLDPANPTVPQRPDPTSAQQQKIHELIKKDADKIDTQALKETIVEIKGLVETIRVFAASVKADGTDEWDVFWLVFKVWAAETLRLRNPSGYTVAVIAGLLIEDDEILPQLDPASASRVLKGETNADDADALLDRIAGSGAGLILLLEKLSSSADALIKPFYGWDPEPGSDKEASVVAARALSVAFDLGLAVEPMLTLVPVRRDHGGPGLFLGVGGTVELTHDTGAVEYTTTIGAHGAFSMILGWDGGRTQAFGPSAPKIDIEVKPKVDGDKPYVVLGAQDATRLEIGTFSYGIDLGSDTAGFKAHLRKGKLVIELGQGDGFLANLPGGKVEVPFELGLIGDTKNGIRFDGGTGLKVDLPVAASVFGVFTVQNVALELVLSGEPLLELRGGFSLQLGAFQATVDQIGLGLDLAKVANGVDEIDELISFLAPRGIALALEIGPLKGGGYINFFPERGEYSGALSLKALVWGIDALALVMTKRPDGSEGWSLITFVYAQFEVHIAFGIFWSGLAGMVGLHHRADMDALTAGMKTGALDDILFPENPVADAPRIIGRYKTLFPVEENSLLVGLMAQFSFSKPPIVYARIGFVLEWRNALGGEAPAQFTKLVLLGQVLVQLPPKALGVPAIVKILVDVVGFYDAPEHFLLIRARLRDSFIGIEGFAKLDLTGEMVLAMRFGDEPSFVLSSGGFHPAFKDVPRGVPDKLERLAVSFGIGPIKLRNETYFAITSNSVQGGWKCELSADIEVASIKGHLSFDALLYLKPKFHFQAELQFQVSLEAFGEDLCSVRVEMTLQGPGEWRAKGHFSFSILWWDYEIGFDEHWGNGPSLSTQAQSAAQALLRELREPDRLLPGEPVGGNALVALAEPPAGLTLAHPLGLVTIAQKAIPLEVEIDRMGTVQLTEGKATFTLDKVLVGEQETRAWEKVTDHFARGQFMDLTEQQKLEGRSFETFTSGARIGTTDYRVDTVGTTVKADYEVEILEPEPELNLHWKVVHRFSEVLQMGTAVTLATFGAAGASERARIAELRPDTARVVLQEVPLAVVDPVSLVEAVTVTTGPRTSEAVAQAAARASGGLVVEAFEVAP